MLTNVLIFADEHDMLPPAGRLIACVSGGADSMCLLDVLLEASRLRGFSVVAAHYNHMLRGGESDRDEAFVRDYCLSRGIPFHTDSGDVRGFAGERGLGVEEAARAMRYAFFSRLSSALGASRIATAHTADDNAETVLLNLTRGAGSAGLSGIPAARPVFKNDCSSGQKLPDPTTSASVIRPLLCVSRDEVMRYINGRGIPFVHDSTNFSDIYTRNKLRSSVIPVLKGINPRFTDAVSVTAKLLRADDEYLSEAAGLFINDHCMPVSDGIGKALRRQAFELDASRLAGLPFAVSSRVVRRLCADFGCAVSHAHVMAALELCGRDCASGGLSLPGMTVYRKYGNIIFSSGRAQAADGFEPVFPDIGKRVAIPGTGLVLSCSLVTCDEPFTINKSFTYFLFKCSNICGKMSVRPRRTGDIIKLTGQGHTKTLKKLFIERQIPVRDRALIPVIADEDGVLAVYSVGVSGRAAAEPGDMAVRLDFTE